jgi:hypothetical protein
MEPESYYRVRKSSHTSIHSDQNSDAPPPPLKNPQVNSPVMTNITENVKPEALATVNMKIMVCWAMTQNNFVNYLLHKIAI